MNIITFACLFLFAVVSGLDKHPEDPHNHETLPNDENEMMARLNCVFERGPCSEVMKNYLQQFPTSLQQACAKCNSEMMQYLYAIFENLKEKYPVDYKNMKLKFDPQGKYFDAFEAAIADF